MKCGIELCPQTLFTEKSAGGRGVCVLGVGTHPILEAAGSTSQKACTFYLEQQSKLFLYPPGAFGRAGAGKKSLRPSKPEQLLERVRPSPTASRELS